MLKDSDNGRKTGNTIAMFNKAGYTATLLADGWAGVENVEKLLRH